MRGRLLPIAESAVLAVALSCSSGCGHEARSGPDGARQGNEATSKASRLGYVALGDSFTIGTGTDPSSAFPARLVALQEARGCRFQLQNLAKNGFITDEVIARQLPETNVDGLRLVTFSTGANELVRGIGEDEYRASLRRLFALLHERFEARSSPRVRIVVVPQPDWSKAPAARSFGDPAALSRDISRRNEAPRRGAESGSRLRRLLRARARPLRERERRARWSAPERRGPRGLGPCHRPGARLAVRRDYFCSAMTHLRMPSTTGWFEGTPFKGCKVFPLPCGFVKRRLFSLLAKSIQRRA